ncbi:MAG TPA: hypothetical protein VFS05_06955, partial [Gemmatimonadaceae bacterium]|nr:hypothetical protein [Gemmatimonadaceae bacterium]
MMMERDAGLGPVPEDLDLPGDAAARDPGLAVLSDEALLERLAALGEPCVEGVLYAADLAHEVLAREQGTRDPARRDR